MISPPSTYDSSGDLLSCEVFSKYLAAREHEVFFMSLRYVEDRRVTYPEIIAAFTDLLAFFDDATALDLLDSLVFRRHKELGAASRSSEILEYLNQANARGVALLGLAGTVTFDSLRASYKNAAKKYHPDVGGTNEEMKLVNAAFMEFHDLISQWNQNPSNEESGEGAISCTIGRWNLAIGMGSAAEYFKWLETILMTIYTDSWAVDKAFTTFRSLCEGGWESQRCFREESVLLYVAGFIVQLAERLHIARLSDSSKAVLQQGLGVVERAARVDPKTEIALKDATEVVGGRAEAKIIIKHLCQAENLFRLGIISEGRFAEAQARFAKRHTEAVVDDAELRRFQENGGFIPLLSYDSSFDHSARAKPLIPFPDSTCKRIDHLTAEQRAEYFWAFGPSGSREVVRKYTGFRTSSFLCSLIHLFAIEEAEKIERECEFLWKLFPEYGIECDVVLGVSNHLRCLDEPTRGAKLLILRKLDPAEKPEQGFVIRIHDINSGELLVPIEPTYNYLQLVLASVERLTLALETGSIYTRDEEEQRLAALKHDLDLVQYLHANSIGTKANDADYHYRKDPQKVVEAFEPHVRQLITASQQMAPENVGQLMLGDWISGLTAGLVKLKRWGDGKAWLDFFFGIDPRYQDRLAGSERDKMLARLARCEAELARGKSTAAQSSQ